MSDNGTFCALLFNVAGRRGFGNVPPLSLLYLAAVLRQCGVTVQVFDRRAYDSDEQYMQDVATGQPSIVGIPLYADTYTATYRHINLMCRFDPRPKVVLGGPELSADPERAMTALPRADYGLAGEAEYTFADLVEAIGMGDTERIHEIPGLIYRENDELVQNGCREPLKDLDSIPFPARDAISWDIWKSLYHRPGLGRPTDVILTSRGCPFHCNFCFRLTEGYRARSAENVLAEIDEIHARGAKGLNIVDDNFTVNRGRCEAILEGIISRKYGLAIKCRGRVNSIDEDLLRMMKSAGVRSMAFGIESGSQKILDAMNKKTTVEQNAKAIELTRKVGMQSYADLFLGYPGETPETIQETSDFLIKAKPTGINLGVLFPLRGTTVYQEAAEAGTLVGDWGVLEEYPTVRLPWDGNGQSLHGYARNVAKRFYRNPGVIWRGFKANVGHFGVRDYLDVGTAIYRKYVKRK